MKKLFTNDKFFLAMVLCAVICETAHALLGIFVLDFSIQSNIVLLIRLLCVLTLYISYKAHSKNVMKGMMGALLMAQFITAISLLSYSYITIDYVCYVIFAVLSGVLFVNHFIINSDRKANPAMITINQIVLLLLVINNTVLNIVYMIVGPARAICIFTDILDIVGFAGMVASVVCVESRLDAYRLDREAAGWTEEKGYPANYDRTKNYGVNNKKKK